MIMSNREDFERAVLKLMPFTDISWSEVYEEYTVPGIQHRWKGYQMRQPEIYALQSEVTRLRNQIKGE